MAGRPGGGCGGWVLGGLIALALHMGAGAARAENGASIHNVTQDTWHTTIQEAVDLAEDGDELVLGMVTYEGPGNHSIDLGSKALIIRSENPADPLVVSRTVLNIGGTAGQPRRAFYVHGGQGPNTVIAGLTIQNGYMGGGGAIACEQSGPTIRDCVFKYHVATGSGGAILCTNGAQPQILRCHLSNSWAMDGGALALKSGSDAFISECVFQYNNATANGGAVECLQSAPQFVDCAFADNETNGSGGGLWNNVGSDAVVTRCVFVGNSANWAGGGAANHDHCNAHYSECTFEGNVGGSAGGIWNFGHSDGLIEGCLFLDNTGGYYGGAIAMGTECAPLIRNCSMIGNDGYYGGALFADYDSAPRIEICRLLANTARRNGGACDFNHVAPQLRNCLIAGNAALDTGGGIVMSNVCHVTISGLTVVGNDAAIGGGIAVMGDLAEIGNTIVWGNTDNGNSLQAAQLFHGGGTLTINYSSVAGWNSAYGGVGNLGAEPDFADLDGPDNTLTTWEDNNCRLRYSSLCIDRGMPTFEPQAGETDLDARLRVRDGNADGVARVDMGAFEFEPADVNSDGNVDATDGSALADCMQGPGVTLPGACGSSDLDRDGDADLRDWATMLVSLGMGA